MKTKPIPEPMDMMHIRVPLKLKKDIESLAAADFRDSSSLVRMILSRWRDDQQGGAIREQPAPYGGPQPSPAVPAASRATTRKRKVA